MLQVLKSQLDNSIKSVRLLLQRPITLKDGNLALGDSKAKLRAAAREEARKRVRQMRRDLHGLLGQHPSSRQLMRHLATVEMTLRDEGLEGFEAMPVRVIAKALKELERLVQDWSPIGLAELRSRMAVIVKSRASANEARAQNTEPQPLQAITAFGPTLAADVTEVDHAEFEEMERSWVGVIPPGQSAKAAAA